MSTTKIKSSNIIDGSVTSAKLSSTAIADKIGQSLGTSADVTFNTVTAGSFSGDGSGLTGVTSYTSSDFAADLATKTTDDLTEGNNLYYTDARVGTYLTNNSYATQSYVTTAISNLVDSAPSSLDTLNELAAALNDDANFASTVITALSSKQETLVSGANIKTINGTTLLGSGDITISGGTSGGSLDFGTFTSPAGFTLDMGTF